MLQKKSKKVFSEEEMLQQIRNESWNRDHICAVCSAERNGKGVISGSDALDQFTAEMAAKNAKCSRGTSVCTSCPFNRSTGRPGIGHEKNVHFGQGKGHSAAL